MMNVKEKIISVAMATYNGEKYIIQQIESILSQSKAVDEIIIVDDNSDDNTVELIENLNCPLIQVYQNKTNLGYIENFYKAIALTKGKYVFLSDQDDIWEKDKVEKSLFVLQKSSINMAVCTGFSLIDQFGNSIVNVDNYQINNFVFKKHKPIEDITLKRLAFGNIVQGCTYCIKRDVIDIYLKIHNKEVIHDYQLMLLASSMGKVKYLNEPLIRYRLHGNNAIGFSKKKHRIEIPTKKASKEPFMARFFKQMNEEISVPKIKYYLFLYYFRVPYLIAIIKHAIFGG